LNAKKAGIPFGMTGQAPTEVRIEDDPKVKEEGHSDFLSRGLSYHSIGRDAGRLDFWVRNETR
jgi:hypothetical protein|tara:strand:- start:254 stop:442 length:189 start_codon:yes stop_codon:yes gene_type:complete